MRIGEVGPVLMMGLGSLMFLWPKFILFNLFKFLIISLSFDFAL